MEQKTTALWGDLGRLLADSGEALRTGVGRLLAAATEASALQKLLSPSMRYLESKQESREALLLQLLLEHRELLRGAPEPFWSELRPALLRFSADSAPVLRGALLNLHPSLDGKPEGFLE